MSIWSPSANSFRLPNDFTLPFQATSIHTEDWWKYAMNACICTCKAQSILTFSKYLEPIMEKRLSPEDFQTYKNRPKNQYGLRIYEEEKEYLYPGKAALKKFEILGEEHEKSDSLIDKTIEQILHDVLTRSLHKKPRTLEYQDDDQFKDKRKYKARARPTNSENKFTCAYCLQKFKTYDSLKTHVSKGKNTTCHKMHTVSGQSFVLEIREKNNAKKFPCPHCGKRYVSQDSLRRHAGVHNNIQP